MNLLTVLGLVALMLLLAWTAPSWSRLFRAPLLEPDDEGGEEETGQALPAPTATEAEAERRISVKLYFRSATAPQLETEERAVRFSSDLSRQVQFVAEELLSGSRAGLFAPFPEGSRVLDAFVTADGTAYLDLSIPGVVPPPADPMEFELATPTPEPEEPPEAALPEASPTPTPPPPVQGSKEELLAVYSLVNTLAANLPAVRRVQILLEGRPARTLGGHVDLTRPLAADMTYLGAAPQSLAPPPAGATGESAVPAGTPEATSPPQRALPSPSTDAPRGPGSR